MSKPVIVDTSGLSCPQPALLTRNAIRQHPQEAIVVLVDTATSRDNCTRLAEKAGYRVVATSRTEGGFRLELQR